MPAHRAGFERFGKRGVNEKCFLENLLLEKRCLFEWLLRFKIFFVFFGLLPLRARMTIGNNFKIWIYSIFIDDSLRNPDTAIGITNNTIQMNKMRSIPIIKILTAFFVKRYSMSSFYESHCTDFRTWQTITQMNGVVK